MPPTRSERPPRSDAIRNRAALVDAAAAAFRSEGLDVAVDEIARRAGLGVATLYRHFPAKLDLIVAVTDGLLDRVESSLGDVLAAGEPESAIRRFLLAAMDQQRENRGFFEALAQRGGLPDEAREALAARVVAMLEPVVAVAHDAGTLDPGFGAEDVLVAMRMLGTTAATADGPSRDRALALVLGGLARPAAA